MEAIGNFFQNFLNIGSTVVLPIFIFIFAMILGTKPGRAFRSAVLIGISLTGINIMVQFLGSNLGPAMQKMVDNANLHLDIMDVGWGAVAGTIWATPIGAVGIPVLLIFNIILLYLRQTKTLMIDMWNYHHLVTIGALIYVGTGNFYLGILGTLIGAFITWKLADWSAPFLQKFYNMPGISLPTLSSISSLIIAVPVNALIDHIPGLKDIKGDFASAKKYLGVFGESSSMAIIIGIVIGLIAKYDIKDTLKLAINLAAVMVILPKVVAILMDGLMPISEAAREKLEKKYGEKGDINLGLDSAISIGHPSVITAALILTPFTILLAAILPMNRVLPFTDLASITFRVAFIVALVGGNVFRTLICGIFVIASVLICGTITSPLLTQIFVNSGEALQKGVAGIASFSGGSLFITFSILQLFLRNIWPILICAVIWVAFFLTRKSQQKKSIEINSKLGNPAQ